MDYVSLICCILAFLLYYNTLEAGFVYDDRRAILSNPDILPKTPWSRLLKNDFWGTPLNDSGSHGSYRPLCVFTFRLNYLFGGLQPWGYHLVNVLLHCMATVLLIRIARLVLPKTKSKIGEAVSGLLFAAHPIHTEAVAGIVGRADLAACNFYFLSFLAYSTHVRYRDNFCCSKICRGNTITKNDSRRYHKLVFDIPKTVTSCNWPKKHIEHSEKYCSSLSVPKIEDSRGHDRCWSNNVKVWVYLFGSLALALAAMLSKETGITVLGVCFVYDVVYSTSNNKKQTRSLLILASALSVILTLRLQTRTPQFSTADNPTARDPHFLTRAFTFSYLPAFNFWLLLFPNTLSFDWGMDAIPRIATLNDSRIILSVAFYVNLTHVVLKNVKSVRSKKSVKVKKEVNWSKDSSCTVCRSNIFSVHSTSCRASNNNNTTNFQSSSCVCLNTRSHKKYHKATNSGAVLLSLAFLALPFLPATNIVFYVGFVVAERVLYLPSSGLCLLIGLAIGSLWSTYKRYRYVILVCFVTVLVAFSAKTVLRNRDWQNEEVLYKSAIAVNPPKAYGNLGSILNSQGRVEEAESAFRMALHFRPNMADVHYNL